MSPQITPRLHVDLGGTTEIVFKLDVAGANETITVSSQPPLSIASHIGLSAC